MAGRKLASSVKDLTAEKWATGAALIDVATPFQEATHEQQKEVLLAFLKDFAQKAIAQGAELCCPGGRLAGARRSSGALTANYNGSALGVCAAAAAR